MDTKKHQFYYTYDSKQTFHVEVPTKKALQDILKTGHITINIGHAKRHPNDQFIKKIGREVAISRTIPVNFELNEINIVEEYQYYYLLNNEYNYHLRLQIKTNRPTVYLVDAVKNF